MAKTSVLPDILRKAGAVMSQREGEVVPVHFGSAAGELAVCTRAVGLAVRPDLTVLRVNAEPRLMTSLLERVLGHDVSPGGVSLEGGAWWCRSLTDHELTILCRRKLAPRIARGLRLRSNIDERLVLSVLGRRTNAVLADLGVFGPAGDPHAIRPFSANYVDGHAVTWLLEGPTAALALADPAVAADVWHAIDRAGHRHGISCVGLESVDRYRLLARAANPAVTLL